jgi:hypothetical protein
LVKEDGVPKYSLTQFKGREITVLVALTMRENDWQFEQR